MEGRKNVKNIPGKRNVQIHMDKAQMQKTVRGKPAIWKGQSTGSQPVNTNPTFEMRVYSYYKNV